MPKTKVLTISYQNKVSFGVVTALFLLTFIAYLYLVSTATFNTSNRQALEQEIINLRADISHLELSVIEKTKNLNESYANELGLAPSGELVFIERKVVKNLSYNE